MVKLKPWYDVVKPREDLREGKPLDASEFAVHLDKVRLGNAPDDYRNPAHFFDRTFLAENLEKMAAEVVRRLSGITTEASAVFNMTTQFGGGKTHALTLLYHLARHGSAGNSWRGVRKILDRAGVATVPDHCSVAVFVGTEFDSITGRGGDDGTPKRQTPWGELAWQLGGMASFAHVAAHDEAFIEPKGDVIEKMLPADRPCLILMDEVLNYASTYREQGYHNKLYNFVQALSETVRGRTNAVLVGSIPASELSYTDKDYADQQRLKNLLDRVGKAVIVSVGSETSEIVRRRLFEWDERWMSQDGRVLLTKDAEDTCRSYAEWVQEHRLLLPGLINPDLAREEFRATYPLHPMVLSVFERKWQTLPRFQQTRGVLRLLALWISRAYHDGYRGAQRDPLITLGSAPLDDAMFRAAVFEQLGETKLEAAVTTDVAGKIDSHATRLDDEATEAIRKARLHRKVATTIFFESNGGQIGMDTEAASISEIREAVGEPDTDIGNIETVLDALTTSCYYLDIASNLYRFNTKENLNKRFADRRATVPASEIDVEIRRATEELFARKPPVACIPFPATSLQVPDRPATTILVADVDRTMEDETDTLAFADQIIRESGASHRTFKNALIWVIAASAQPMREEARKLLAWQAINDEAYDLRLDEAQKAQLYDNVLKAKRDLKEAIWRSYKHLALLGKDNTIKVVDLGLVHSSAAETPITNILSRLSADGDVEKGVSPNFLVRNWPPAFTEWATQSVRDAFYASPVFPRLLNPETIKETIARGVEGCVLAYVGKSASGKYQPFAFGQTISASDIEFSGDMFIVTGETAQAYLDQQKKNASAPPSAPEQDNTTKPANPPPTGGPAIPTATTPPPRQTGEITPEPAPPTKASGIRWAGEVPSQKWMNFYTKVLSRFAATSTMKLTIHVEIDTPDGVSAQSVSETRGALRELGLDDRVTEK